MRMALVLTAALAMMAVPVWAQDDVAATAEPPAASAPAPGAVVPADPKPESKEKPVAPKPSPEVQELRDREENPHIAKVEHGL